MYIAQYFGHDLCDGSEKAEKGKQGQIKKNNVILVSLARPPASTDSGVFNSEQRGDRILCVYSIFAVYSGPEGARVKVSPLFFSYY